MIRLTKILHGVAWPTIIHGQISCLLSIKIEGIRTVKESYLVDFYVYLFTAGANGFVLIFSFDESLLQRKLIHVSTFMVENRTKRVYRHTFFS